MDSLAYAAACPVLPEGVDEEHQHHLDDRGASGGKCGDTEVVNCKLEIVFLGIEGVSERFLRVDDLTFAGANPKHVRVAGVQKRLDIVVVVRKQHPCR